MPSSKLTDYYVEIAAHPSYTALGMVFKATLEEIANAVWEGADEAMPLIITALDLAEKVEEYYDEQA